ncbi:MAG: glycosyl transferase family 2 [Methanosphaera sp. SHI613]|jgi:GT2 family glycosyltransferase|nr:MAG: glycosyl transferase family 2 [Methanosphaera sp. SHI613]
MDLSIIIVNYGTYQLTKDTVISLLDTIVDINYEIIIVDNDSPDDSFNRLDDDFKDIDNIMLIQNDNNDGFAKANNIGIRNSTGEYVLLLNSDVIVKEHTINQSLNYIKENKNIGCLGCKVVLPDGNLDKACRRSFPTFEVSFYRLTGLSKLFPNSKRFNRYNLSYLDENEVYPVDCVVGAFMLIPRDVLIKCGCLDESYFMYGEDIELCYNIKELGYDVIYYGKTEITHYKGASGKSKRLLYEFHNSMQIFYDKHYKQSDNFLINAITYIGIWSLYYVKLLFL